EAADVEPDGGVELERVAAGGGLWIAEQDADLHADLVDEDDDGPRLGDRPRELPERLRHEARLEAHLRVAHVALDLGARHEGRHRVDHEHVERARAHERVGDLERLLAVVGLRDQKVLGLDAELPRVAHVERVLGVDEGRDAATLLRLGDELERERRLARRLGAVDLDNPASGNPADAEGDVQPERARRQTRDVLGERLLAQLHDGALAELLLDLTDGEVDSSLAIHIDAHVTPSPARCPPSSDFRRWNTLPRPPLSLQPNRYIFSALAPPQRVARDRRVDRARRTEPALVEGDLRRGPSTESTRARRERRGERP